MTGGGMRVPVFDLDGTLIDSDAALVAPFVALGVGATVPFGLPLAEACRLAGIEVAAYLAHYDDASAAPFAGVDALIARLGRWAVCSNKHPSSGQAELSRLGWRPDVASFADPGGGGKELGPVLAALELEPDDIVFVGDTDHDRHCARTVGCRFVLAGWNPRARTVTRSPTDALAATPLDVLDLLRR